MVHLSDPRIDSRIQRLAGALAARGDEVDLVCLGAPSAVRVGAGTIRAHPVGTEKPAGGPGAYVRGYLRFLAAAGRRLTRLDLDRRFDVVEIHNMPDVLTAAALGPRLRGTPVILDVHDTFPELFATLYGRAPGDPLVRLVRAQERVGAALADHVIVVTGEARERLASRGVGVGRCTVVMNAPDGAVLGPARPARRLPAAGPMRLLYLGGLAPRFGVETLIRAFGRLRTTAPRVHARICGPGADRDRLARLAAEVAPDRIEIPAAPVPFAAVPAELAAADVGVVPTLHDAFTELLLPVKLLEYVHAGLPVVSSRLPAIGHYFTGAELRTFAPGDPAALAAAVEAACADPDGTHRRAQAAGARLADLGWERERARYLALVDRLAGRAPDGEAGADGATGADGAGAEAAGRAAAARGRPSPAAALVR